MNKPLATETLTEPSGAFMADGFRPLRSQPSSVWELRKTAGWKQTVREATIRGGDSGRTRVPVTKKNRGGIPPRFLCAEPDQAGCAAAFAKLNVPPCASTRIVSAGAKCPARISFASGFSSSLWIARLSGRAP